MTIEELQNNLKDRFGIITTNCYPKKTFLREEVPTIGLFGKELKEDFYFIVEYTGKYYKLSGINKENFPKEIFGSSEKYQIPLSLAQELKNKPKSNQPEVEFKEQEDAHFMGEVTLRDLATLFLKKPVSNKQWLNDLVK